MQIELSTHINLINTPNANLRCLCAECVIAAALTTGAKKQGKEKKPDAILVSLVFPG